MRVLSVLITCLNYYQLDHKEEKQKKQFDIYQMPSYEINIWLISSSCTINNYPAGLYSSKNRLLKHQK